MIDKQSLDQDPTQTQIETLVTDEERQALAVPYVPDETKTETLERLDAFAQADLEQERAEDAGNEP